MSTDLLTAQQVADVLQVHASTIRTWARRGWIPYTTDAAGWRRYRLTDGFRDVAEATVTVETQLDRLANMPEVTYRGFDLADTDEI